MVRERPKQVTILAIGPLTNIAMAVRMDAAFAANVKQLIIMGGAIAALPDGAGNHTPNAEFNFYVHPEAARIVLRSGISILLSPLSVSRKARLTKEWFDKLVAVETPITRLLREQMADDFAKRPDRMMLMYDQVAAVSLVAPSLAKTVDLFVDVDANPGASDGVSVGGREMWLGGEGAQKMQVQTDLEWERFIRLWGSWANTQKLASKEWRFELFYWDYAIAVLLFALALAFTFGSTGTAGRRFLVDLGQADGASLRSAFIGGAVFNLSSILLVAAIDIAGMAAAFPIGVGLALVLGVITNYLASPVGNATMLFVGVGCVVAAILLSALAYSRLPAQGQRTRGKGIVLSVVAGFLMDFFYRFVAASMSGDFVNLEPGSSGPTPPS